METNDYISYVKIFDEFYTTNHIEILKTILPHLNLSEQLFLPVIIKFLELEDAIAKQKAGCCPWNCRITPIHEDNGNFQQIYQAIEPYLTPSESQTIQQILQFKAQMENIKQMQQMMSLFQDLNPDNKAEGKDNSSPFDDNSLDLFKIMQLMKDFQ